MKLAHMELDAYLQELASRSPAPGGGSASALCGAQGAGLAAMVAGLTIDNAKYADRKDACVTLQNELLPLMESLAEQIDADADAFDLVASAFKLPKSTDEEKAARSKAIQDGTMTAALVPTKTMALSLHALRAAQALLEGFNTNAASDLGVAAMSLLTAVKGAWLNVQINCASLKDREAAEELLAKGRNIVSQAEALSKTLRDAAEAAIG